MAFLKKKKTRWIVIAAVALLMVVVVWGSVSRNSRGRVNVQTQKAGLRDLTSIVSASGEIRPKRYVNVSSDVAGRILELFVKEGDRVKAGQPLCRIDATRFAATKRSSEAGLQAAKAELKRTEADIEVTRLALERARKTHQDKLISDQEFERAQADYEMKQALFEGQKRRIVQQEAALEFDADSLEKTIVNAPMTGVVTALLKEEGETVIGAQSFQPTVIMTVADLSDMEVEILVDETDIQSLKLNQEAEVRVDALPNNKIKGEVTEIGASAIVRGAQASTTASSGNQAKDFKVAVTLKNPPPSLRPGLNATADITTARKEKVLAVPIQAVVVREVDQDGRVIDTGFGNPGASGTPETGSAPRAKGEEKEGVFVIDKEQAVFRAVKTGIMGETEIEIASGLKEGEEIVTGSYKTLRTLRDKARVKIERRDNAKAEKK
jgi:HlyD family secretion protein